MGGGYQHIPNCMFTKNLVGYHHLRKWLYWNLFIGRNVAGTVCIYFSKAVLAVGNIIIRQDALLWSWSLNGETMMISNSWMISFNLYVWSLKMYRSSSLKSEHVWKVPNTACFKDRLHLQYLSRFFQVIEQPTMENHTWDLFSLVFTFPSISSKPKESYVFLVGSCFVQHQQWTIKRPYSCLGKNNGMFIYPLILLGCDYYDISPNLSIPGGFRTKRQRVNPTWRIIPVSKCLVTPIYKPFRPFGRGTTLLGVTI